MPQGSCCNLTTLLFSLFSLAVIASVAGKLLLVGALDQAASSRPAPVTTSDQAITAQKNKSHIAATQKNVEMMRWKPK